MVLLLVAVINVVLFVGVGHGLEQLFDNMYIDTQVSLRDRNLGGHSSPNGFPSHGGQRPLVRHCWIVYQLVARKVFDRLVYVFGESTGQEIIYIRFSILIQSSGMRRYTANP